MPDNQLKVGKILVTGGAGFIGSHVVDSLLLLGMQVLIVDNYKTGQKENNTEHPLLEIVVGDVADKELMLAVFNRFRPDVVVHAAATYSEPDNWELDVSSNIEGTISVIRAAQFTKVTRFIYLQTSLCYGITPLEQPITLKHPYFSGNYKGGSSYAISKTVGELYLELSGLNFISFRLANTYGPRNLTGPLPAFYKRITEGMKITITDTRRDFIYVDDLVACIVKAVDGKNISGYYNLSTGQDTSIKELFDEVIKQLNPQKTIAFELVSKGEDDVATILTDPQKTIEDFGWRAVTTLKEGIQHSLSYYKAHGLKETYTHLKQINKQ